MEHESGGSEPESSGWALSALRIREDLYHLPLCAILVGSRMLWELEPVALGELRKEFEQEALDHALITIAIRARVLMDQTSPRPVVAREPCGKLVRDANAADEDTLSLREACNKIIHADSRVFEEDDFDPEFLTGHLALSGTQMGQAWRAVVNTFDFVKLILALRALDLVGTRVESETQRSESAATTVGDAPADWTTRDNNTRVGQSSRHESARTEFTFVVKVNAAEAHGAFEIPLYVESQQAGDNLRTAFLHAARLCGARQLF